MIHNLINSCQPGRGEFAVLPLEHWGLPALCETLGAKVDKGEEVSVWGRLT